MNVLLIFILVLPTAGKTAIGTSTISVVFAAARGDIKQGSIVMSQYDNPIYDEARRWIQRKHERGISGEDLRCACKSTDEALDRFLHTRRTEDDWPLFSIDAWKELVTEMEEYENKQHDFIFHGHDGALFDESQDNNLQIPENERSCWQLYKKSLGWKPESIQDLEEATIGILRRMNIDTSNTGPIKGLVIGHVQSGKTANMEALMAMAADHGWNMFIVLSGSIESLRLQTLRRMQKDLNQEGNLIWRGVEHPSRRSQYGERTQDFNFKPGSPMRYFTVCLKNTSRLKKLIDWIHADRASHDQMKILLIDDEADQASISNTAVEYQKEQRERKGINKLIVHLVEDTHYKEDRTCGKAGSMNYVMYTATPYANFLNESTADSLYPRNFIWTLKTSNEYIGPNQIFGFNDPEKSDGLDIKRWIPDDDLNRIAALYDGSGSEIPESMKDAICWFVCAVAVMRNWHYKKPISMLVHTSQKQANHDAVANAISKWIDTSINDNTFTNRCRLVYEAETIRLSRQEWCRQFSDYGIPENEIHDYPEFDEILPEIRFLISQNISHIKLSESGDLEYRRSLHLVIDNCSKNGTNNENEYVRLAYPDPDIVPYPSPAPAFIIVGGSTLSRGLTIEGLVSTFFLRASCQADTLMQMGRWFGYRKGYELLPRIWMTQDTIAKFRFLSELEVDLREDLKKYMLSEVRPVDYGPRLLCSPKVSWLKLTSKRHSVNAKVAEMDFSGARPQTVIFERNNDTQRRNIKVTENFIGHLGTPCISADGTGLFWKNVSLTLIMEQLLIDRFSFSPRSRVFNEIGAFCDWIRQLSRDHLLGEWSVIVAGTDEVRSGVSVPEDSHHWIVSGYQLKKVNRSRRRPSGDIDADIDIGALRALKDLVADVDQTFIPDESLTKQEQVDAIRKTAGVENIPMLIIYRIDKDSKPTRNIAGRAMLNMECDIIGLQICIPGDQINSKFCKRLTIQLPQKDKEEEVEDTE